MLNNIWNWLMQPTADGATYLQAIIMTSLLCGVLYVLVKDMKQGIKEFISLLAEPETSADDMVG